MKFQALKPRQLLLHATNVQSTELVTVGVLDPKVGRLMLRVEVAGTNSKSGGA